LPLQYNNITLPSLLLGAVENECSMSHKSLPKTHTKNPPSSSIHDRHQHPLTRLSNIKSNMETPIPATPAALDFIM
jgi:hypothetical protein